MDTRRSNHAHLLYVGAYFFIVSSGIVLQGCQNTRHTVVAATGTSIGVEVSQNPANQSPQAKLGYHRAELAIVPSNRSTGDSATGSMGAGARDVADVLMELRYGGIFDLGATSGIYQRLAVGSIAVTQPGAAFMFAKGAGGELDPQTAAAVERAQAAVQKVPEIGELVESEKALMRKKFQTIYDKDKSSPELPKFEIAAQSAGYPNTGPHADFPAFRNFVGDLRASPEKTRAIRRSLELQGIQF